MTALPPISNRRVVGLKDGQIKLLRKLLLNPVCSHPECSEKTEDAHHIFPRSLITNDSWWVEITDGNEKKIIPHVTGLCREHHRDVEEHRAWIKYEDHEEFLWYEKKPLGPGTYAIIATEFWTPLGPLTPQPGEVQHPKKKTRQKKAPAGTAQKNLSAPAEEMKAFLVLAEEARVMLERPESRRWLFYTLLEVLTVFVRDAEKT